jgi:hypothetical protein
MTPHGLTNTLEWIFANDPLFSAVVLAAGLALGIFAYGAVLYMLKRWQKTTPEHINVDIGHLKGPVRRIETGPLASAGVLGIAVGFAAQKTLGNFIAGIQIALTQLIRIDDVVIVENELGKNFLSFYEKIIPGLFPAHVSISGGQKRRCVDASYLGIRIEYPGFSKGGASCFFHTCYLPLPLQSFSQRFLVQVSEDIDGVETSGCFSFCCFSSSGQAAYG